MALRRRLAQWNRVGPNRVMNRIAPWVPGFGVVEHRGRTSGKAYATPVDVFRSGDRYVVALFYGPDTDWVKNVLAAGECDLVTRRQRVHLHSPELFHDETRHQVRVLERQILTLLGVADFLALKTRP